MTATREAELNGGASFEAYEALDVETALLQTCVEVQEEVAEFVPDAHAGPADTYDIVLPESSPHLELPPVEGPENDQAQTAGDGQRRYGNLFSRLRERRNQRRTGHDPVD